MNVLRIQLGAGVAFAACIALSTVHPWGNPHIGIQPGAPLLEGANVPENVRIALATKCGDCHSETTRYPIYSHIAPVSWMIEHDVREGRQSLNMSQWQSYSNEFRISVLTRVASEVHTGQMPPRNYVMLHPGARLSQQDLQLIYDWAKAERKRIQQAAGHVSDSSSFQLPIGKP